MEQKDKNKETPKKKEAADPKARKWQLTINEPAKKNITHETIRERLSKLASLVYYCMSDEIAARHHMHLYLCFGSPVRFSTLKNLFPEAHLEKAYGTSEQNRDYVFKTGKWEKDKKKETNLADTHEEWGIIPDERQGARSDLAILYEMIEAGMSNYEIINNDPDFIRQIDRIDKVRQAIQEEANRDIFRNMQVCYIYGATGTGKTRSVMEEYGYANVHRVTNYKNPFDQYRSQDVVCFEEFNSSLPIEDMLKYLDGYPLMLPCRYADKVACYTKVYILSNLSLTAQYQATQHSYPDTWDALLRRIHLVRVFTGDGVKEYGLTEYMAAATSPFIDGTSKKGGG